MTNTALEVPVLMTAMTGPLHQLEQTMLDNVALIEAWFEKQWQQTAPSIYGSVDLRHSGFKLAPVDMNLFPAGFNNLNRDFMPLSIAATREAIEARHPGCKKILLVPENHTRNQFYWDNVASLTAIIEQAGYQVELGVVDYAAEKMIVERQDGENITIPSVSRDEQSVFVNEFKPDIIWLNNDLSNGVPEILAGITQTIMPPLELGWHSRLKSVHFNHYQQVVQEFSAIIQLDPWFIDPLFQYCGQVDFMQREGEECLAQNVEKLLTAIEKKYQQYDIKQDPFVVVKSDSGTYGMNVMVVKSADQVRQLNRKQRTKMSAGKGGQSVGRVIMQEGVYSFETIGAEKIVAEPVVYAIGKHVIGGFYRVHKNKGSDESLNAPGMHFEPLQFCEPCNAPDKNLAVDECLNRFYAYGVVARLSVLAAAREMEG